MGVDPGTRVTGYGIIRLEDLKRHTLLDYGCIRTSTKIKLSDKYFTIFTATEALLEKYHPQALAVETPYVQKNPQSALKLGMAQSVVIIAAKQKHIPVFGYSPSKAKRAVVGNGKASKYQVQKMVQLLLTMSSLPEPEDAADALALAICHLQATQYHWKCRNEI